MFKVNSLVCVFLILVAVGCAPEPDTAPPPAFFSTVGPAPRAAVTFASPATPSATRKPSPTATRAPLTFPLFSPPSTETPAPQARVLRIGHSGYPDVLDPQKASTDIEIEVLRLVYEGLVTVDDKGIVQPGAAERWELSSDGTQMTFHLRPGLKRVDGTPLTARDMDYAIRRAVDPRVDNKTNTFLLYDIKGAQELVTLDAAKSKPDDLSKALANLGIKAVDDSTLVITFKKPVGYWAYIASLPVIFPSDKKRVDAAPDNWWFRSEGHNGNGPFFIRSLDQGKRIVLAANPNYWRGQPKLDRIELVFYPTAKDALDAYKRGEIDIDADIEANDIASIESDSTITSEFFRYPSAMTLGIGFNSARKPFDDKNVRIAFSQALDREGWVRQVLKGSGKPYTRWIPPDIPGAQPEKPGVPAHDPQAAIQTLVNSGYAAEESTLDAPKVDCAKLGEIRLTFASSAVNQTRFQFLADNWTRVIGCPIKLDPINAGALRNVKDAKTGPQVFFQGYLGDYAHPQNWLSTYWACATSFALRAGYCNKNLDALLAKADQEPDLAKSIALYQQAEDLMLRDVPSAFANYGENVYLIKPYVIGPADHKSSSDIEWIGEWGPVWSYDIDLRRVPATYPRR